MVVYFPLTAWSSASLPPPQRLGEGSGFRCQHHKAKGNPSSCVCQGTMLERPFQGLHFSSIQKNLGPGAFLGGWLDKEFLHVNILVPSLRNIWDALAIIPGGLLYSDPY